MSDFSLNDTIDDVLASVPSLDQDVRAKAVLAALPAEEVDGVLLDLLRHRIDQVAKTRLRAALRGLGRPSARPESLDKSSLPADLWEGFQRVIPVDGRGTRKRWGDFTADDLELKAAMHDRMSESNQRWADGCRALAALLGPGETLSAIDPVTIEEVLAV